MTIPAGPGGVARREEAGMGRGGAARMEALVPHWPERERAHNGDWGALPHHGGPTTGTVTQTAGQQRALGDDRERRARPAAGRGLEPPAACPFTCLWHWAASLDRLGWVPCGCAVLLAV